MSNKQIASFYAPYTPFVAVKELKAPRCWGRVLPFGIFELFLHLDIYAHERSRVNNVSN